MDLDQIWSKDGLGQGQELIKIWGANHFFQNFHELKCWKIVPAKRLSSRLKAEGSLTVFDFPNLQRKLTKWKAIAFSGKLLLSVESYCFQRKENEEGQGAWKCNNWLLWLIIYLPLCLMLMMRMIVLQGFRTKQTTPSQPLLYAQQIAISSCDAMNNRQVALVFIKSVHTMYRCYEDEDNNNKKAMG